MQAMNLRDGIARFLAMPETLVLYPLGAPRTVVSGPASNPTVTVGGGPIVEINGHAYSTSDQALAEGMLKDPVFGLFFHLDASCLPPSIIEFWNRLNLKARVRIGCALVQGESEEKVFDMIREEDLLPNPQPAGDPGFMLVCPVTGCNVKISSDGSENVGQIQAAMASHLRVLHPDWAGN